MGTMKLEQVKTIANQNYLDEIIESGWTVVGPRKDLDKDLRFARNFLKRNIAFFPEHVLEAEGFEIVPPSPLTRGHQLMYKDEGKLVRYTKSQYKLVSGGTEIPLYILLREEDTDL